MNTTTKKPNGAPVEKSTGQQYKPLSMKKLRRLMILAAVFLVAVIVIIIVIVNSGSAKFEYVTDTLIRFDDSDGTCFFVFNNTTAVYIDGSVSENIKKYSISYSGKYAAILTNDSTLYVVNSDKCVKFDDADNIYDYVLSPFSDRIFFIKDYEEGKGGNLYMSSLANSTLSTLVSDFVYPQIPPVASPNGDAVAFATEYTGNAWTINTVRTDSAKIKATYDNVKVEALSDDARFCWYTDTSGDLYVSGTDLSDGGTIASGSILYNGDASEAVVVKHCTDGKTVTYLVKNGKSYDKNAVEGEATGFILPDGIRAENRAFYNVDSFVKTAVTVGNCYYYVSDGEGVMRKITALTDIGNGEVYIADDCETVYFRKDNQSSIKHIRIYDVNELAKEIKIAVKVSHFKMSNDGKTIYFLNTDNKLYYLEDESTAVGIADGIYETEYYIGADGEVYYAADYAGGAMQLYTADKSNKFKKIKNADDARELFFNEASDTRIFRNINGVYRISGDEAKLVYKIEQN